MMAFFSAAMSDNQDPRIVPERGPVKAAAFSRFSRVDQFRMIENIRSRD